MRLCHNKIRFSAILFSYFVFLLNGNNVLLSESERLRQKLMRDRIVRVDLFLLRVLCLS